MLANLLAMPVVSAWVMPMGILGVLALPFGFDGFFWRLMGEGIDWMIAVALWVASLPGAVGRVAAFGTGPLLLGSLGLVVLCLLRSPLRLAGAALIGVTVLWVLRTPQPDVLVAPDATSVAVRTRAGQLAMVKTGSDTFAIREWLGADADARSPKDETLGAGITCDGAGCVGRLAEGSIVAIARTLAAFEEDCRRAALVVTARDAPPGCATRVIDRQVWQRTGALALWRVGKTWEITAARPVGYDRPWTRAAPQTGDALEPRPSPPTRPQTRDATPSADDLDPGD